MKKRFELFDHTADIGMRAYGKSLKEVFENAAYGMFSIMADLKNVKEKEKMVINIENKENLQELLVGYLSELLYYFSAKELIFKRFDIKDITQTYLKSEAFGEFYNQNLHQLKKEIKTITYHTLKVEKLKDSNWFIQVIFDV
jgi:SHS2 domain-containing protein